MGNAHRRRIILRFLLSEILKGTKIMNFKPIFAIAMVCLGVMSFTAPRSYALSICWGNDPNDTYEVDGIMDREPPCWDGGTDPNISRGYYASQGGAVLYDCDTGVPIDPAQIELIVTAHNLGQERTCDPLGSQDGHPFPPAGVTVLHGTEGLVTFNVGGVATTVNAFGTTTVSRTDADANGVVHLDLHMVLNGNNAALGGPFTINADADGTMTGMVDSGRFPAAVNYNKWSVKVDAPDLPSPGCVGITLQAGNDVFVTDATGTSMPVLAALVPFKGEHLETREDNIDTIVQRLADVCLVPGHVSTIPIKLVELSLRSLEPFEIGADDRDLLVILAAFAPGTATFRPAASTASHGEFDSVFPSVKIRVLDAATGALIDEVTVTDLRAVDVPYTIINGTLVPGPFCLKGNGPDTIGGEVVHCVGPPQEPVPTVSEWGVIILTLLLLTIATIAIARGRLVVSRRGTRA